MKCAPAAPPTIKGLPPGVFVLVVLPYREDEILSDELAEFLAEQLSKSMSLRRKFRGIIPNDHAVDYRSLMADYALHVDLLESKQVKVPAKRRRRTDPEEMLAPRRQGRNRRQTTVADSMTTAVRATVSLRMEQLRSGEDIWTHTDTLQRHTDEMWQRSSETLTLHARGGVSFVRSLSVWHLIASEIRKELSKLR